MKLKNTLFQFIVSLLLLSTNTPVMAQYLKPGDIIYENDALEGTTPQGVVFWVDSTGYGGWIVNLKDQSTSSAWSVNPHDIPASDITTTTEIKIALSDTAGWQNTRSILNKYPTSGGNDYAVNKVDFANGWYLPAVGQLRKLYGALPKVNETLEDLGSFLADEMTTNVYWSSTAYKNSAAWYVNFDGGALNFFNVPNDLSVRSVRAFNSLNYLIHSGRVAVSGNADSEITNNIVFGNKDKNNGEANLTSTGTVSYTAAETTAPSGAGNTTVAVPDFADYTGGDYRLATTSALIGAGNVPIVPTGLTTDLDNLERVISGRTDMGAYQSQWMPVTITNPLHVNGYSGPSDTVLCDVNSYDLSLTAAGDICDYTWYRDGQQIVTTTDSICTITEAGTYTVDVNGVLDTVSSGPVTVRFSSSPVITKNLQDTAIVGGSVILTVEATGPGLEYQWYFNNQPIADAVTESLKVREEGVYVVQVSNECGSVSSATAHVTYQIVDPIIMRRIDLPQVEGIVTTPSAGIHYVESRADFFFYMSAAAGYSLDEVTVSTNRGNEVLQEPTDDGRIKVTIKRVNAAITIRIEGVRHGVDNALVPESKVWGSTGVVYFSLPAATDVSVYTLTGTLYERRRLPAGDSRLPMPAGVYIITLETGLRQKIVIP